MLIYKTRWFTKWAKKQGITDQALIQSVDEIDQGLASADLGGSVYKKRVAMQGQGKRGATRVILAYKT